MNYIKAHIIYLSIAVNKSQKYTRNSQQHNKINILNLNDIIFQLRNIVTSEMSNNIRHLKLYENLYKNRTRPLFHPESTSKEDPLEQVSCKPNWPHYLTIIWSLPVVICSVLVQCKLLNHPYRILVAVIPFSNHYSTDRIMTPRISHIAFIFYVHGEIRSRDLHITIGDALRVLGREELCREQGLGAIVLNDMNYLSRV